MAEKRPEPPKMYRIAYPEKSPPVAALAVAELAQISVDAEADPKLSTTSQPVIYLASKQQLAGKTAILRFLARVASDSQLAGSSVLASVEVDHWIDYSVGLVSGTGFEAACARVNDYLALRTLLAGHTLSAADLACWAQLSATLQWDGLKKSGNFPHLARWYEYVSSIPEIKALAEQYHPRRRAPAAKEAKSAQGGGKKAGGNSDASFDIGLGREWEGRVVTRFPPEPSGFLHVGHAKALILNQQIAAANRGRMRIRFDDTNPDKEKDEFVDSILEDAKRLGADVSQVTYTSNYFDEMLDLGERLIRAGHLYADDTPQEKMKEERMAKQASQRRGRSVEENLRIWKEMIAGTKEGFLNCMRFKIDPANNNGALRDPVAYRCNDTPHLHSGTKYKVNEKRLLRVRAVSMFRAGFWGIDPQVYPTYDCACPFVDALEGVTHALRTSEYRDREEQFYRILKMQQQVWPGLPDVAVWDYSRLSFVNTVLSKRKLTKLVAMGAVDGWDDPRMPTVQGLLRRGLTVPALREFILAQGASKNVTYQEWDKIWSINKKVIDPVCPRHTAVKMHAKVPLTLTNVAATDYITVDRHNKNPAAGKKVTERGPRIWLDQEDAALLKEGEEVTLMEWGNAIVQVIRKNALGEVGAMEGKTNLQGNVSSTKWKLTWLADSAELVPLSLVDFDHLINKKKLEEEDEIEDLVTLCSRWETEALGDANMRTLQKGDVIQLMRKGYFIVDLPFVRPGKPMVLLSIPDGKAKTLVKPEAAVKAAAAARAAAKAAAAAAAKSSASAAALNPKVKPVDMNGEGAPAKGKKGTAPAEWRKAAVEGEETPVSSKVTVQLREEHSASSPSGAQARQACGQEPSDSTSPSATTRPIPVPNRSHSNNVPPTPANTPQTGSMSRAQGSSVQPGRGKPPQLIMRELPTTPTNTPANSEELSRPKLPSVPGGRHL